MANRFTPSRLLPRRTPGASSLAANAILALAMVAAIVIGISDFDAGSIASGLIEAENVQGDLPQD
ncbi:hypothetical protein Dshi_2632 [Dinoroseobacter shibae DFL 12 = DSM 16493]|jgi:urocanate hydratase|uniref:Uncharacterized protein n=1 Tax=Dinoroseobacter shibae (strain DSM 16493 / NCIMB 14021 / DFL 12) TaxID=398580 RepID=A8LI31_DINSH|nr:MULTISPECIES: hypothetical protein [Dinoroseobacter]ABV94365.1 hypothetical protein Dshi_2632 [Dinoroseobacter shibae DFL 12 = DSM 16493]MDD9717671.1 hypothetical protein [Dinoroseobacter sp. PD6]URF45795.1 hypothetical protein M8008_13565 [Dinoroseobacter shibae]URF50101.1 hypothetical protein M8007_13565 [Dinoroseobacter shibae]